MRWSAVEWALISGKIERRCGARRCVCVASLGAYAHDLPTLLHSPTELWSFGGSILAPLFDAGRLRAQAEISASLRDRAVFAYEAAVRNAFADTDNALTAVRRLREQLTSEDPGLWRRALAGRGNEPARIKVFEIQHRDQAGSVARRVRRVLRDAHGSVGRQRFERCVDASRLISAR